MNEVSSTQAVKNTALSTKANKKLLLHTVRNFSFINRRSGNKNAEYAEREEPKRILPFAVSIVYSVWLLSVWLLSVSPVFPEDRTSVTVLPDLTSVLSVGDIEITKP